jgi:hypothetical protein
MVVKGHLPEHRRVEPAFRLARLVSLELNGPTLPRFYFTFVRMLDAF